MLFRNARIENSPEKQDIRTENGLIREIGPSLVPRENEEVRDLGGHLVLPPFVESHIHLDATLTAGDPVWNMSGTLFEGIECWARRKDRLTVEDVKTRARKAVELYALNGVQFIRTHVDVTDPELTALKGLLELREEIRDLADIQVVAFPQEGILSFPNGKDLMEEAVRMGVDAIGAIPHFEFTREYGVESLNYACELAARNGLLMDVHCDETDDDQSRGLETLATRALELGLKDTVTASHTCAMHSYSNAYVLKLMRLLKMSGINFVSNPLVNTHLEGRADTYPKRRGVTRVKELTAAGINVSFGNDDLFDPWYPMGCGSMRDTVYLGLHVTQMMGYEDILNSYRFVTVNAAKTLHLGDSYGITPGRPASFVVLDAEDWYGALSNNAPVVLSVRKGRVLSETRPAERKLFV